MSDPAPSTSTNTTNAPDRGYALFDLDQTLIPWDTQLLFCNFVLKRHPWRRLYLLILIPFLPLYKLLGSDGMKRVFLNYLVGFSRDEIDALAEEFVEETFPDGFYGEMLDIFEEQKRSGRTIVLSSASPEFWVIPIGNKLGAHHIFATSVDTKGRVSFFPDLIGGNNKGSNKIVKMRCVLPADFDPNLEKLPNSHGFSDSHADLPMLSICEQNTLVNPTEKLRACGKKMNWEIRTPPRPTHSKWSFALACFRQALGLWN